MCLGIPLRVCESLAPGHALCRGRDESGTGRRVNTALLDSIPNPGDWLLVHVDVAIRSLADEEALQIDRALQAVEAAASGLPFEHLLADLIDREPELPEHLRSDHSEAPLNG